MVSDQSNNQTTKQSNNTLFVFRASALPTPVNPVNPVNPVTFYTAYATQRARCPLSQSARGTSRPRPYYNKWATAGRDAPPRLNLLNLLNLFVSFRAPRMRRFVCGVAKRPAGLAMEGLRRPTKSRQGAKPDSAKPTQVGSSPRRLSCTARQRRPIPSILLILSHPTPH